jgi:hypothetical protein
VITASRQRIGLKRPQLRLTVGTERQVERNSKGWLVSCVDLRCARHRSHYEAPELPAFQAWPVRIFGTQPSLTPSATQPQAQPQQSTQVSIQRSSDTKHLACLFSVCSLKARLSSAPLCTTIQHSQTWPGLRPSYASPSYVCLASVMIQQPRCSMLPSCVGPNISIRSWR